MASSSIVGFVLSPRVCRADVEFQVMPRVMPAKSGVADGVCFAEP
jgi:hypothetical protein